jgi:hypothetical protein
MQKNETTLGHCFLHCWFPIPILSPKGPYWFDYTQYLPARTHVELEISLLKNWT